MDLCSWRLINWPQKLTSVDKLVSGSRLIAHIRKENLYLDLMKNKSDKKSKRDFTLSIWLTSILISELSSWEATSKKYDMCVDQSETKQSSRTETFPNGTQHPPSAPTNPPLSVGGRFMQCHRRSTSYDSQRGLRSYLSPRSRLLDGGKWSEWEVVSSGTVWHSCEEYTHTKKRLQVCNLLRPSARELWDTDREPVWILDLANIKQWKSLTCWGWKIPPWAHLFLSWATKSSLERQNSGDYILYVWRQILKVSREKLNQVISLLYIQASSNSPDSCTHTYCHQTMHIRSHFPENSQIQQDRKDSFEVAAVKQRISLQWQLSALHSCIVRFVERLLHVQNSVLEKLHYIGAPWRHIE